MLFGFKQSGTPAARTDRHRLAGIATVDGNPSAMLVVVLLRATFALVAATTSSATTGHWEIKGIQEYPLRSLLVVSVEPTGSYNAVPADFVSQVTA